MNKYDPEGPFNDPIVRCTECQKVLFRNDLQVSGKCICGCRKVRSIEFLSESEMKLLKNKKIDPEYLALFEGSPLDA